MATWSKRRHHISLSCGEFVRKRRTVSPFWDSKLASRQGFQGASLPLPTPCRSSPTPYHSQAFPPLPLPLLFLPWLSFLEPILQVHLPQKFPSPGSLKTHYSTLGLCPLLPHVTALPSMPQNHFHACLPHLFTKSSKAVNVIHGPAILSSLPGTLSWLLSNRRDGWEVCKSPFL